jgi:uncharacterized membrane protein
VNLSIFGNVGIYYLVKWFHFIFGIIWIGHLYYFNFTQMPSFAEMDGPTKSNNIQKLVPRALWWFRWGAMFTFITGVIMLGMYGHMNGHEVYKTSWGVNIMTGSALGTLMFLNVWLVIWPAQQVVIASTTAVAKGQPALPEAAAAGARAMLASRTNTLFSIPMLFFMGAASHLPLQVGPDASLGLLTLVLALVLGAIEWNAVKGSKLGPLATVKGVIHVGVVLTVVLYLLVEVMVRV